MEKLISKVQYNINNFMLNFYYYNCARDAMFDVVNELNKKGYNDIYIPGYIGWSPKEGSGIFDPLNSIPKLLRHYYRMTAELYIDVSDLKNKIKNHSILLVVNYFGFRDLEIKEIIKYAHSKNCIVIEDNAHGFYTYFCNGSIGSDITFFSLHKMFPFERGGGMIIENGTFDELHSLEEPVEFNPFKYNYNEIAKIRIKNYKRLLLLSSKYKDYFEPLRDENFLKINIPQTFPIIIKRGERNKIYEIMNDAGYGVVSLYHTMIEELRTEEHSESLKLSKKVMNLPVHQDVECKLYNKMIEKLVEACEKTM